MSNCEQYAELIERFVDGECSESEKLLLDSHLKECKACKEELDFALSIKSTLRSLPKIEVPDNFLVSLNEKLDMTESIKTPVIRHYGFFNSSKWKKYSALTACLLLAVVLKTDISEFIDMSVSKDYYITTVENAPLPEPVTEPSNNEVFEAVPQAEVLVTNQEQPQQKQEVKKPVQVVAETVQNPVQPVPQETKTVPVSEKIVVVKASTPHSSVEIPGYMDNRENIIMAEPISRETVKFDDFVVSDELLEAFSLAEIPSNKVIVASPAVMSSMQNMTISTDLTCAVPLTTHGAGSGSLVVSASDEERVQSLLNKYFASENNKTFMLSSKNYNSFIDELRVQGIEYRDYMIHTEKTNVAFQLMVS